MSLSCVVIGKTLLLIYVVPVQEYSVRADLPQIAFRKLRQEYVDMGYGVDPEADATKYSGGNLHDL